MRQEKSPITGLKINNYINIPNPQDREWKENTIYSASRFQLNIITVRMYSNTHYLYAHASMRERAHALDPENTCIHMNIHIGTDKSLNFAFNLE